MARIPGFDELIKQFIEAMKNADALKTSESPPQRTFPIGPAGGVQSAIEITKNIGSKVAEANKKAEKIIGLGESYISGEMSFPEYLNRVQDQTTQEMAKAQNQQLLHQCQGRWNLLDRLKNLPRQVNDLKNSVD